LFGPRDLASGQQVDYPHAVTDTEKGNLQLKNLGLTLGRFDRRCRPPERMMPSGFSADFSRDIERMISLDFGFSNTARDELVLGTEVKDEDHSAL
jgi:hypothetical protein